MSKVRLDPGPFVLPMPTALIGAEVDGKPNFMTAAFVGIANYKPAIVACGLSPTHHTSRGIAAHGEFSLCLPGPDLVEPTDWCGLNSGKRTGKAGVFETKRLARIPIAEFRARHRIPDLHMHLYRPVLDQYRERYDHSLYLKELPDGGRDALRLFQKNARWLHYW